MIYAALNSDNSTQIKHIQSEKLSINSSWQVQKQIASALINSEL